MTLPDCMMGPSEPCSGYCELQRELAEARAALADCKRFSEILLEQTAALKAAREAR